MAAILAVPSSPTFAQIRAGPGQACVAPFDVRLPGADGADDAAATEIRKPKPDPLSREPDQQDETVPFRRLSCGTA